MFICVHQKEEEEEEGETWLKGDGGGKDDDGNSVAGERTAICFQTAATGVH